MRTAIQKISLVGMLLLLAAGSATADAVDSRWSAELTGHYLDATAQSDLEGEPGFGLALEYRASELVGLGLAVLSTEYTIDPDGGDEPGTFGADVSLKATPILARLNFHLTPDRRADFFIGPMIGYVPAGEIEARFRGLPADAPFDPSFSVDTESELIWGAHLGVDVPLGSGRSFFTASATYLKNEVTVEVDGNEDSSDLDPLVVSAGFGIRF